MRISDWSSDVCSSDLGSLLWNASASPSSRVCAGHFGVEFEQFFEALGVVFEVAADVDAFEDLVVEIMRVEEVLVHFLRIVDRGDVRGDMRLAGETAVLRAAGPDDFVRLGWLGGGKGGKHQRV